MKNEIDVVRDVSAKLEAAGIAYMLTGSMAMNYYAEPRMTRDIDLVVAIALKDVDRFVSIFGPEYYISKETVVQCVKDQSMFNLIHQETVIKVDCIVRKSGEYRQTEFDRRQKIQIEGFTTYLVSKEDLILSKLAWAKDSLSEQQLKDVRNLMATGCDAAYLAKWTEALGVATLLERCRHE